MDDSCAVCADALEWVTYGACGHKEALGDYTRMINDFSVLPSDLKEGKVGSYWYHEDTQAFFDDVDHYKMIKAMCNLFCSVCDKMEGQPHDGSKRLAKFRNIEQLKGHYFHQHKLVMCSLCLEGRKVFICEQKLYSRAQLKQHISTGDSEVDGSESERGGFMGHPICEFCRSPFYGENELSTSVEHFLCEDEACLAKKFTVFQSEGDLKRHNALEHEDEYHVPSQDCRRGRGRTFQHDSSEDQLSMAIEASLETSNADRTSHDPSSLSN
ncbi:E3 ubiquitin-protein ligase HEL2, partial [Fagus crenata]